MKYTSRPDGSFVQAYEQLDGMCFFFPFPLSPFLFSFFLVSVAASAGLYFLSSHPPPFLRERVREKELGKRTKKANEVYSYLAPITYNLTTGPVTYAGEWDTLSVTYAGPWSTKVTWYIYACFGVESREYLFLLSFAFPPLAPFLPFYPFLALPLFTLFPFPMPLLPFPPPTKPTLHRKAKNPFHYIQRFIGRMG